MPHSRYVVGTCLPKTSTNYFTLAPIYYLLTSNLLNQSNIGQNEINGSNKHKINSYHKNNQKFKNIKASATNV